MPLHLMKRLAFFLLTVIAVSNVAVAAEFDNLVERGEFFNEKGLAYASDAVRVLEKARDADPARAAVDLRFGNAISDAYIKTFRYTEAFGYLQALMEGGRGDSHTSSMLDFLLNETGAGRLRLESAAPVQGLTGEISLSEGSRLDSAGKKALDKLEKFLSLPHSFGKEGLTLLIPEGSFKVTFSLPLDAKGSLSADMEIWAGDELVQKLVGYYPPVEGWVVEPGNRRVSLGWARIDGASSFELYRSLDLSSYELLYAGEEAAFTDSNAPLGVPIYYKLFSFGPQGEALAVSEVQTWAEYPVSEAKIESFLNGDLTISVPWAVGEGSLDSVVIWKVKDGVAEVALNISGETLVRYGELLDGPVKLTTSNQPITYRLEAWLSGAAGPAAIVESSIIIPPRIARVDAVYEDRDYEEVHIEWETFPKDALAEGYAIYSLGDERGVIGELVGRVENAHAREYNYTPSKKLGEEYTLRHFVLPYIGDQFLVKPFEEEASAEKPTTPFSKRRRVGDGTIPNLALSWDPYEGATRYLVTIAGKERQIIENYIEFKELQNLLMGENYKLTVEALLPDGKKAPVLSLDLDYTHYPRQ